MTTLDDKARAKVVGLDWHTRAVESAYKAGYRAALAEPTEAEIEEVAKALHAEEWKGHRHSWEREGHSSQQYWRDSARAALSAFLKLRSGA